MASNPMRGPSIRSGGSRVGGTLFQGTGIRGLERVVHNLNQQILGIEGRTKRGLIKVAAMLREDMDKTPPVIPVDTGALRNSWHTITGQIGRHYPYIIMGFGGPSMSDAGQGVDVHYSIYVHEMVGANFKRPGSGAKWFQAALYRNRNRILNIIVENARIPK